MDLRCESFGSKEAFGAVRWYCAHCDEEWVERKRSPRKPAEERHARANRVQAALGDGRVICDRCGATLDTYGDACTAPLDDRCPGFEAIEQAGKE